MPFNTKFHFRDRRGYYPPRQGARLGLNRALLESRGSVRFACRNSTPYINVDPGTMNPFQHGEVFGVDADQKRPQRTD